MVERRVHLWDGGTLQCLSADITTVFYYILVRVKLLEPTRELDQSSKHGGADVLVTHGVPIHAV